MDEQSLQNAPDQPAEEPLIPWERRNKMSFFKAYFGTISYIVSMRNRLDEVIARPVCLRSAKKFRGATVCLATFAWLLTVMLVFVSLLRNEHVDDNEGFIALILVAVAVIFTYLFMLLTTGAIKWFFCPMDFDTEMQDRAIALSYYTCGPLITVLLSPIILGVSMLTLPYEHMHYVVWAMGVYNLLSFISWYTLVLDAVHSATGRKMKRTIMAAIGMPVVVLGIPFVLGLLLPAITMWVMLYYSVT